METNNTEFGIFNDEGMVEGGFYKRVDAEIAVADRYSEDDVHVAEVCPDHEDEERASCKSCACGEPDEEESEDEE